jgi:hypothetical protein
METGMSTYPKFHAITDTSGRFQIEGAQGDVLSIDTLQRQGYEPEPGLPRSFGYNTSEQYRSDVGSPVLFRLWRQDTHAQLTTGKKSFRMVPDGRIYTVDLATGLVSESGQGDLSLWIRRSPEAVPGQRYEWSAEIAVVNGGLNEPGQADYAMYLAPAEGYTNSFSFHQRPGSGWGDTTGQKRFYLALNGGRTYGRLGVQLYADYNREGALARVEYALNTNGSRALRP